MSFKINFRCGNPPLCSGVIAVPSGPKSHTLTVILLVLPPSQDGVINRAKVYSVASKARFSLYAFVKLLSVLIDQWYRMVIAGKRKDAL